MARNPRVGLVFLLFLAGCVGGSEDTGAGGTDAASTSDPIAPEVSFEHGAILGTVADTAIYPIPSASIELRESSQSGEMLANTSANEDGQFVFSLVLPGTYRLHVFATDFGTKSALVQVRPQEITRLTITLDDSPSIEPYLVVLVKNGLLSCSVSAVWYNNGFTCEGYASGSSENLPSVNLYVDVPQGWKMFISETEWRTGEYMTHLFKAVNATTKRQENINWATSKTPIRVEFSPGSLRAGTAIQQMRPAPLDAFRLRVQGQYSGQYADEINQTAYPACTAASNSGTPRCHGVGFAAELRFSVYSTIFVHAAPTDPALYSALPDR